MFNPFCFKLLCYSAEVFQLLVSNPIVILLPPPQTFHCSQQTTPAKNETPDNTEKRSRKEDDALGLLI